MPCRTQRIPVCPLPLEETHGDHGAYRGPHRHDRHRHDGLVDGQSERRGFQQLHALGERQQVGPALHGRGHHLVGQRRPRQQQHGEVQEACQHARDFLVRREAAHHHAERQHSRQHQHVRPDERRPRPGERVAEEQRRHPEHEHGRDQRVHGVDGHLHRQNGVHADGRHEVALENLAVPVVRHHERQAHRAAGADADGRHRAHRLRHERVARALVGRLIAEHHADDQHHHHRHDHGEDGHVHVAQRQAELDSEQGAKGFHGRLPRRNGRLR